MDQAVIEIPAPPPAGSQPWPDPQTQPVSRNGHVLQLLPDGGAHFEFPRLKSVSDLLFSTVAIEILEDQGHDIRY